MKQLKFSYIITIIVIILLTSCNSYKTTIYTVTDYSNRNYYVNQFRIKDKCISFTESSRGQIKDSITICGLFSVRTNIIQMANDVKASDCKLYIKDLIEQGYCEEWATHKALVEYKYIPEDKEYLAIQED